MAMFKKIRNAEDKQLKGANASLVSSLFCGIFVTGAGLLTLGIQAVIAGGNTWLSMALMTAGILIISQFKVIRR